MTGFVLSSRAREDLDDIWDYTVERWDADQAERYVQAIESVASNPRRGRPCGDVRPGYWKRSAGSHVIFFRVVCDKIDVVRILHRRMDFDQHL